MIIVLFTKLGIVFVEHVVSRLHLPPLGGAKDVVRVITILANAMKLNRVLPVLGEVLIWCVCVYVKKKIK